MHYIKCGVNSSLLTYIIRVAAQGLWYLGSLFYHNTYYSQWGWFINLLWCDIPRNNAPRTGWRHIRRTYTLCPFSGCEMNRDSSRVWWMISLAIAGYGGSQVTQHLLQPHLVFQPIWGWVDLGFFSFFNKFFTRRSLKSRWVYLALHEDNRSQLLSTVRSRRWKNNFVVHLKVHRLIK